MNSFFRTLKIKCPNCSNQFEKKIWTIVDITENPELTIEIVENSIHQLICDSCSYDIGIYDSPLLLVVPPINDFHPIFISPARLTSKDQDRIDGGELLSQYYRNLGISSQDDPNLSVISIWRDELSESLRDFGNFMRISREKVVTSARIKKIQSELSDLSEDFDEKDHLKCISLCTEGLELIDRENNSELWAGFNSMLGSSLTNCISGNRSENLERAILSHKKVLEVWTREKNPFGWAETQMNLGNAYFYRQCGNRAQNLEKALKCHQKALRIFSCKEFPEKWLSVMMNMGNVYCERIKGDRTENVEIAISCYIEIIENIPSFPSPIIQADLMSNLGLAYSVRIVGEKKINLDKAVEYFKRSLSILTYDADPIKWAVAMQNLAIIYSDYREDNDGQYIEFAIETCKKALNVMSADKAPYFWAQNMINLGNFYRMRIRGNRGLNIENSINFLRQSLTIASKEEMATEWSKAHVNLGHSYLARVNGDKTENENLAVKHLNIALEHVGQENYPREYVTIRKQLGDLRFQNDDYEKAYLEYEKAIDVYFELLYESRLEMGRQFEIEHSADIYPRAAFCLVKMKRYNEALITLEAGKTRLFTESFAFKHVKSDLLSLKQKKSLFKMQQKISQLKEEIIRSARKKTNRELLENYHNLRNELKGFVNKISVEHPSFFSTSLDINKILESIPVKGALVSPLFTSKGSLFFVVPYSAKRISEENIIHLDGFTVENWLDLLKSPIDVREWGCWMGVFSDKKNRDWYQIIDSFTKKLWDELVSTIYSKLNMFKIEKILFVSQGGIGLLPIHAAWRVENGGKRYMIDDYEFLYTPSLYALYRERKDVASSEKASALVVGVGENVKMSTLPNVVFEAQVISQLLNVKPLINDEATRKTVIKNASEKKYLHFGCHSQYNWKDTLSSPLYLGVGDFLTITDVIENLDLDSTVLVTLSACETGVTNTRPSPDENFGQTVGFMVAGAKSVISSLWEVDDRSTSLLMYRFYKNHLGDGASLASALREAQIWLKNVTRREIAEVYKSLLNINVRYVIAALNELTQEGGPDDVPYSSPYYWASFTYSGK